MKKIIFAFAPTAFLLLALFANLWFQWFGDPVFDGYTQGCLFFAGLLGIGYGQKEGIPISETVSVFIENIRSVAGAILILLLLGALATAWTAGGIIPAMAYYGVDFFSPGFFLPCVCLVCSMASVTIGSSWATMACLGGAFMTIGLSMGFDAGPIAGAVVSGAYFGDKLSPLSDTTNLASGITGVPLKEHIRFLLTTTVPTYSITLLVFAYLSLSTDAIPITGVEEESIKVALPHIFETIHPALLLVPLGMFLLFSTRLPPWAILSIGIMAGLFTSLFQYGWYLPKVVANIPSLWSGSEIVSGSHKLADLLNTGGASGSLMIVLLVVVAMFFAASLQASGALQRMLSSILGKETSTLGLVTRTVVSCLGLNIATGDQYISVVLPAKAYQPSFIDHGLHPKLLSRTVEDSGSVTSVLFGNNSCGAWAASVLSVSVGAYLPYAIFCYLSPLMTIAVVAMAWRIPLVSPTEVPSTQSNNS